MDEFVKSCSLHIGGRIIDTIYNEFDVWRHIYNIDDKSIVPFHFCKKEEFLSILEKDEIRIEVELYEHINFELTIDLYEWENSKIEYQKNGKYLYSDAHEYHMMLIETDNVEKKIDTLNFEEKIFFNHVVTHIILKFPQYEIENVIFDLDGELLKVPNEYLEKYNDCYIIPLTESMDPDILKYYGINFGTINKQFIKFNIKNKSNDESKSKNGSNVLSGNIYGLYHQNVRIMNGMLGLTYSK